jgi:hypothetical protein
MKDIIHSFVIILIKMKTSILSLAFLGFVISNSVSATEQRRYIDPKNPGHKYNPEFPIKEVVKTKLKEVELPETFIWNNVNGTNYLTNIRN